MTWVLLAVVCWLAYRQSQSIPHSSRTQQLVQAPHTTASGELLDRDGSPIREAAGPLGLPPWVWLLAGLLYVVCPLDGDFIPIAGWIDDVIVAYFSFKKWQQSK